MTPELQRALKNHVQWFGSYKKPGELKKIQVWLIVHQGKIEFLTPGNSYKVKRLRRNPSVVCYIGSENGPTIAGMAQIVTEKTSRRVYIEPTGRRIPCLWRWASDCEYGLKCCSAIAWLCA